MRTVEFEGIKVQYDETRTKSYKWQKKAMSGDPGRTMSAMEELLCGKDEEVADQLGDDADAMSRLFEAVLADIGSKAKN